MNSFINIKKDFNPDLNFWELNPHLIYLKPFSKLYNEDKSKNKESSSKDMWCILWQAEADEEVNKYYRLPEDIKLDVCKEYHNTFELHDPLIQECINAYPEYCLTVIERTYKTAKDFLKKRETFLKNADYNFDTMVPLENAISKTPKILEDFDKVEKLYLQSKNTTNKVYGNRKETLREKGLIMTNTK